ncbi:hypothetical protein SLEP1_g21613 [Rubroshorea leprosula]|uniref:Uncharacterized protein n=1 Tax=Rubroshorea leprosula TaxID=152421 RepID=A0AAV5JH81_9ROSI|nr:hypothetical protein SLEP1_g21613 [Rubroshorea leprosula]
MAVRLIEGFQGGRTDTEDGNIKSGQVLGKKDGKQEELSVITCNANAMIYKCPDRLQSQTLFALHKPPAPPPPPSSLVKEVGWFWWCRTSYL